jgi:multicomponent Na+:H+ antiporter subunit E
MILFGAFSILVVIGIVRRMNRFSGVEKDKPLGPATLLYLPWLLWQILKSNIEVSRIILNPKLPISPRLLKVKSSQQTTTGEVLYANSITLTPGTISLDVQGSTILVHALTEESAQGVENGDMDRRVSQLERRN